MEFVSTDDDYVSFEENVEFYPNQVNKTHCVVVTVLDDRFVESVEMFDVIVTSVTGQVNTPESTRRVTIAIYDEDGEIIQYSLSTGIFILY